MARSDYKPRLKMIRATGDAGIRVKCYLSNQITSSMREETDGNEKFNI